MSACPPLFAAFDESEESPPRDQSLPRDDSDHQLAPLGAGRLERRPHRLDEADDPGGRPRRGEQARLRPQGAVHDDRAGEVGRSEARRHRGALLARGRRAPGQTRRGGAGRPDRDARRAALRERPGRALDAARDGRRSDAGISGDLPGVADRQDARDDDHAADAQRPGHVPAADRAARRLLRDGRQPRQQQGQPLHRLHRAAADRRQGAGGGVLARPLALFRPEARPFFQGNRLTGTAGCATRKSRGGSPNNMRSIVAALAISVLSAGMAQAQYKQTPAPAPPAINPNGGTVQIIPQTKPGQPQLQPETETPLDSARRIPREEAMKLVAEHKAVYIDVRSKEQYDISHIKGAINIPLAELPNRWRDLPVGKFLITYCA